MTFIIRNLTLSSGIQPQRLTLLFPTAIQDDVIPDFFIPAIPQFPDITLAGCNSSMRHQIELLMFSAHQDQGFPIAFWLFLSTALSPSTQNTPEKYLCEPELVARAERDEAQWKVM